MVRSCVQRFFLRLTVVAPLAHGRVGAVRGVRLEHDVKPPDVNKFVVSHSTRQPNVNPVSPNLLVVIAEAGCGGEDVPGGEDGADAARPAHPAVPVLPRRPTHQHRQDPRLQPRRDRRVLGRAKPNANKCNAN